jgi:hypothetical protein
MDNGECGSKPQYYRVCWKAVMIIVLVCVAAVSASAAGQVEVHTEPEGADIFVEFVMGTQVYQHYPEWYTDLRSPLYIGQSPVTSKPLGQGIFEIHAALEGYARVKKRVELPEDGTVRVDIKLEPHGDE